jgi:hypothetical protein
MEGTSPYGEVCGLALRGTEQIPERRVLLAVALMTNEEAGTLPMKLARDSPRTEIAWDGVTTLKFTAGLKNGNKVTGNFTCIHEANDDVHSLEMCIALTFHPHGWIQFERSRLTLDREDVLKLHIPLSIKDVNMFCNALALPDIERLYGMSLADKPKGDQPNGTADAEVTYREMPWANKRLGVGQRALPTLARVRADYQRAEANHVSGASRTGLGFNSLLSIPTLRRSWSLAGVIASACWWPRF